MGLPDAFAEDLAAGFARWSAQLETGLRTFEGAIALQGARNVPVGATGRSFAQNGQGRLCGWSLRATGGNVTVAIRDSNAADTGDILAMIELAAETSDTQWFGSGVSFVQGLYVVTTVPANGQGQLQGSLWIGAVG